MEDNLITRKFVSTNRITTKNLKVPISWKMGVKESRSTINYEVKPVIQISSESGKITKVFLSCLKNYNIFLTMLYLNYHQIVIDCEKVTIMFPKTGYMLQY
jgi:phage-related protein